MPVAALKSRVVIAVVVQALWQLARLAIKTQWLAVVGAVAVVLTVIGINELLVLLIGGVFSLAVKLNPRQLCQQNALCGFIPYSRPSAGGSFPNCT